MIMNTIYTIAGVVAVSIILSGMSFFLLRIIF
jgi:hypothetical protein